MSDEIKIPDLKACPVYSEAFREVFPDNGRYEELRSAERDVELARWRARGTHPERALESGA